MSGDTSNAAPAFAAGLAGKCAESLERQECAVTGAVPAWLSGSTLLRNGPGTFDIELAGGRGTFTVPHWFDGLTQLHAWEFDQGKVFYRSRHLYPALEKHVSSTRRYSGFDCPAGSSVLGMLGRRLLQALRLVAPGKPADPTSRLNVGVTIGPIAQDLYSKTDANVLTPIDQATLAPRPQTTYTDMNPAFKGPFSAAHGQRDEARKTYYNYTLDIPGQSHPCRRRTYHVFAIPDDQPTGRLLASIRATPAYVHSFAQTENYIILCVWPLLYDLPRLAVFGAPAPAMRWSPERPALWHVIDKGGKGHVATYRSDAFYCFHTINAFEAEGGLAVDLCGYDDASWLHTFRLPHLRSGKAKPPAVDIRRYTLPDLAGAIAVGPRTVHAATCTTIASSGGSSKGGCRAYELPRINKAVANKRYQFAYAAAVADEDSGFFDAIAKVDVQSGVTRLWRLPGHFPGEPIFVARPGGTGEDDGLLLTVVLAGPDKHSYLLVLDARSMKEVARAAVPHVVGFGFHGNLFGSASGESTDLA
ncbi:hypothetical protein ABPG75_013092 [Micractinium tetrahymenae]